MEQEVQEQLTLQEPPQGQEQQRKQQHHTDSVTVEEGSGLMPHLVTPDGANSHGSGSSSAAGRLQQAAGVYLMMQSLAAGAAKEVEWMVSHCRGAWPGEDHDGVRRLHMTRMVLGISIAVELDGTLGRAALGELWERCVPEHASARLRECLVGSCAAHCSYSAQVDAHESSQRPRWVVIHTI
jgi:hypothetical protein